MKDFHSQKFLLCHDSLSKIIGSRSSIFVCGSWFQHVYRRNLPAFTILSVESILLFRKAISLLKKLWATFSLQNKGFQSPKYLISPNFPYVHLNTHNLAFFPLLTVVSSFESISSNFDWLKFTLHKRNFYKDFPLHYLDNSKMTDNNTQTPAPAHVSSKIDFPREKFMRLMTQRFFIAPSFEIYGGMYMCDIIIVSFILTFYHHHWMNESDSRVLLNVCRRY